MSKTYSLYYPQWIGVLATSCIITCLNRLINIATSGKNYCECSFHQFKVNMGMNTTKSCPLLATKHLISASENVGVYHQNRRRQAFVSLTVFQFISTLQIAKLSIVILLYTAFVSADIGTALFYLGFRLLFFLFLFLPPKVVKACDQLFSKTA